MRIGAWRRLLRAAALTIATFATAAAAEPRCDRAFEDIYAAVAPSVARLQAIAVDPYRIANRIERRTGAGVVLAPSLVATNAHLVWGANVVTVWIQEQEFAAEVIGADPTSDLAVLALDGETTAPPAPWGDSDALRIGEDVLAIGHPFALAESASRGVVSGLGRVLPLSPLSWLVPLIQTDAAIHPGSSGGPLIDRCGAVIGVNTLVIGAQIGGVGFATPSNLAQAWIAEMVATGKVARPWHGVHGRLIDGPLRGILAAVHNQPGLQGVMVEAIDPGSPAEKIGLAGGSLPLVLGSEEYLLGGDVIIALNETAITDMETLIATVRSFEVGDKVTLTYLRDGERRTAEITLTERPVLPADVARFKSSSN